MAVNQTILTQCAILFRHVALHDVGHQYAPWKIALSSEQMEMLRLHNSDAFHGEMEIV